MSLLNPGKKVGSKSKIKVHCGLTDFYKYYKKNYENIVDYSLYAKVIKEINEAISNAIIYDGFNFKLPIRLGYISIVKKKYKIKLDEDGIPIINWRAIDYKATKELWQELYPGKTIEEIKKIPNVKRVYHRNQHSNGYFFRWNYDKFTSNVPNKSAYFFRPTRTNTRALSSYIKSDDFKNNYFEKV